MNMSVSNRSWSTVIALAMLVAATLPSAVPAGSEQSPEVVDTCGDAATGPGDIIPRESTDVRRLWYEVDGVKGIIKQKLDLCSVDEQARQERLAERLGWLIHWEVDAGSEQAWTLRVWTSGLGSTALRYRLCQGESAVGREAQTPDDESVATLEIDNTLPETDFETPLERTWIEGGRFPRPTQEDTTPWSTCGVGLTEVHERAPDSGFGESFHPEGTETETPVLGHGVGLSSPDPRRRAPQGAVVRYQLTLNNTSDEFRNVTMDLTSLTGQGWRFGFVPSGVALDPRGSGATELTVAIPRDVAPGVHRFNATAEVRNETLGRIGRVGMNLSVDVFPRLHRPAIVAGSAGTVVDGEQLANHTLEVRNEGNVPDRVRLEVDGDHPGWAELSTEVLDLAPGRSRNVTLRVDVPPGAEPGWYEHRVTAASSGGGQAATTSVVTGVRLQVAGGTLPSSLPAGESLPLPPAPVVVVLVAVAAVALRGRP